MARAFTPKVLTANRLLEGDVVYYAENGNWVQFINQALFIDDEEHANEFLAQAQKRPNELVGVYLADAAMVNGHPAPTHFREEFRTRGPSNYKHGKQEQTNV